MTVAAEVDRLVDEVIERHGRLDGFVDNAGVQVEKTVAETTDDEFDRVIGVNVRGVFHGCRAAVRAMRDRGGGATAQNPVGA